SGSAFEVELVRNLDEPRHADGDQFAGRAPAAIAHHPIAGGNVRDAAADALDYAGEFRAGRKRKRRLMVVFAGEDERAEKIERNRLDAQERFAGAGAGRLDLGELQRLRRAKLRAENSLHS